MKIIIVCFCFQKIFRMNVTSDGLDDLETLFGFWIEGIILPIVACLGIAGDSWGTLICPPSLGGDKS